MMKNFGRRLDPSATALFLRRWLVAPARIGAVAPSSRRLGRVMADAALADGPWNRGVVVELGPGTGRITEALLAGGLPENRLVAIERDAQMAAYLQGRFPAASVLAGDAAELTSLLKDQRAAVVVSSLPLLSLPQDVVTAIIGGIATVLARDSLLIQYTYGRGSPLAADLAVRHGFDGARVGRVWGNLPPATVWRYRKR